MESNSGNRGFEHPSFSPLRAAYDELMDNLETVAENQHTIVLPSQSEQDTVPYTPLPFSSQQNNFINIPASDLPPPNPNHPLRPQNAIPTPTHRNTTSTLTASTPTHSNSIPTTANTASNTTAHPAPTPNTSTTATAPTQSARVRNQTHITRPAERAARNDLESLIPRAYLQRTGGGRPPRPRGTGNHIAFSGAAAYIRRLEARIQELEEEMGMSEEEEEEEEEETGGAVR